MGSYGLAGNMSKVVYTAGLIPLPLPPQETETFSKHQKNKPGILAPRSRPPNFVQITILTLEGAAGESQPLSRLL